MRWIMQTRAGNSAAAQGPQLAPDLLMSERHSCCLRETACLMLTQVLWGPGQKLTGEPAAGR